MDVPRFLGAGLAWQHSHERRLAFHEPLQRRLNIREIFEVVQPLRSSTQFAWSLRAAKQQHAKHSDLSTAKIELLVGTMLELRHAAVGSMRRTRKTLVLQSIERFAHLAFANRRNGLAIVLLVARIDQSVERHR